MARSPRSENIVLRAEISEKLMDLYQTELRSLNTDRETYSFNKFINDILVKHRAVIEQSQLLENPLQDFYLYLCNENYNLIKELQSESGIKLKLNIANQLYTFLFKNAYNYIGTTTYSPHNHKYYFPNLLKIHQYFINDRPKDKKYNDFRFMIIPKGILYSSYKSHNDQFLEFVKWHQDNHVQLWQIDPYIAERIRKNVNIAEAPEPLKSINVSFWKDKYVLQCFYNPPRFNKKEPPEHERGLQISYPQSKEYRASERYINSLIDLVKNKDSNTEGIMNISKFVQDMEDKSKNMVTHNVGTSNRLPEFVVESWIRIEGIEKRLPKSIAFLNKVIQSKYGSYIREDDRVKVLFASGTLGYESAVLCREGYDVTFNEPRKKLFNEALRELKKLGNIEEIDEFMPIAAEKRFIWDDAKSASTFGFIFGNAKNSHPQFSPLLNFECVPKRFPESRKYIASMDLFNEPLFYLDSFHNDESGFDCITLIGNYIAVYENKNAIYKILKILKKTLKHGGIIIIDHRNFEKIENTLNNSKISDKACDIYLGSVKLSMEETFVPYSSEYVFTGDIKFGPKNINIRENDFNTVTMISKEMEGFEPTLTSIKWRSFNNMLKEVGFEEVISYQDQDYAKPIDFNNYKDLLPCDFITHVATNP